MLTHSIQMISDVKGMMIERINVYRAKMKSLPKRILVFRDGVSEVRSSSVNVDTLLIKLIRGNSTKCSTRSFRVYAVRFVASRITTRKSLSPFAGNGTTRVSTR